MRNGFKQNGPGSLIKSTLGITGILGILILIFANAGGIGYFLYLWGGLNVAFALAAWTAFKFWAISIIIGFTLFVISVYSA